MTVLKGRVEKNDYPIRYIWVSSGGCEACDALDGMEYESTTDIPEKPHPNCRCYIDIVETNRFTMKMVIKTIFSHNFIHVYYTT